MVFLSCAALYSPCFIYELRIDGWMCGKAESFVCCILLSHSRATFSDIHSMEVWQGIIHIFFNTHTNVEGRKLRMNRSFY